MVSDAAAPSGNSSVGRASASQAEGRGFESRFPLQASVPLRTRLLSFLVFRPSRSTGAFSIQDQARANRHRRALELAAARVDGPSSKGYKGVSAADAKGGPIMRRSSSTVRLTLLCALAAAIALPLAMIPPSAEASAGAPVAPAEPAAAAPAAQPVDGFRTEVEPPSASCTDASSEVANDFAGAMSARPPRRGYCRCGCSLIPDCSTNADCGGGLCLKGPTCC